MNQLSRQNSITKILFEDQQSYKKKIVAFQINGWLETMKKEKNVKNIFVIKSRPSGNLFHKEKVEKEGKRNDSLSIFLEENKENEETHNIFKNCSMNLPFRKQNNLEQSKEQTLQQKAKGKSLKSGYILKQLRRKMKQKTNLRLFEYDNNRYESKSELEQYKNTPIQMEQSTPNFIFNHQKRFSIKSCRHQAKKSCF